MPVIINSGARPDRPAAYNMIAKIKGNIIEKTPIVEQAYSELTRDYEAVKKKYYELSDNLMKAKVEKGPRITTRGRLMFALGGGILMGFAAALARGCTSGQALSGGALLATGSWAFMMMVFAGGYALAYAVRRQWT